MIFQNIKSILLKRDTLFYILRIVIALSLIAFLVSKIGSINIIKLIQEADYRYGIVVLLLLPFNIGFQYLKWKSLCDSALGKYSKRKILFSLFYGLAGGAFTPARLGELVGRNIAFEDKTLLEVSILTGVDKLFNLAVNFYFGVFSVILFLSYFYKVTYLITLPLLVLLIVMSLISAFLMLSNDFWDNMIFRKIANFSFVQKHKSKFRLLKTLSKKDLITNYIYTILFTATFLIQYAFLVISLSHQTNFGGYIWAGSLMFFAKTIIPAISIGELGIREGASIFFLAYFGITEEVAFNSAFLLFVINVLFPSLIGAILLFFRDKK